MARVRPTDPETSHWAAASVNLRDNQREVAVALCGGGPRSHEALVAYLHELGSTQTASGIRTRCHELVERGIVQWSGQYARTSAGQRTRVWECTHCAGRPRVERSMASPGRVITRTPRALPTKAKFGAEEFKPRTRGASSTSRGRPVEDHEALQRRLERQRAKRAAGATGSS